MNVNFKSSNGTESEDPHFNNVSLLLHMDGTNGSEVFLDSSPLNKTISPFFSPAISTSIKKFGTGAGSFNGTNQYLTMSHDGFDFGTGDFTVEFWAYKTSGGTSGFVRFFISSTQWSIELGDGPSRTKWVNTNGEILFANGIPQNQWVHVAFTRHNGTLRVFFDGVQQSSVTDNFNYTLNGSGAILGQWNGQFYYPGYVDDFRITKGIARYTGNFTPPTAAFPDVSARKSLRFLKSNDGKKTLLRPINIPEPINLNQNLMAFWALNGNLNDSGPNGHNLVQNNGTVSYTTGKVGQCFNYLGNPTNPSLDNAPYLTNSTLRFPGSFTFSMWHKFIAPFVTNQYNDRGNSIVQFYPTFGIGTVSNDPTRILVTDLASWDFQTATNAITIGEWVHYVVTSNADSGEKKLYINGVVAAMVTNSNTFSFNSSVRPLGFGGDTFDINDNTPTPALIESIGVWNRVLNNTEIAFLYNNGDGRELE